MDERPRAGPDLLQRLVGVATLSCVLSICLLVPLVFAPWREQVFAPVKIELLRAIIGLALVVHGVAALLGVRSTGGRAGRVGWADLAAGAYGVANVLAFAHSGDRMASWTGLFPEYQGLATVLSYLAAYGLARVAFDPGPGDRGSRAGRLGSLFAVLTVTTGLLGGYAIAQRLGLDPLWGYVERPSSTVGQANSMAAVLVVGLPACAATYADRRGLPRILAGLAGGIGLAALLASLSRGGWLAALLAGAVGLAFRRPRPSGAGLVTAAALLAVFAGGVLSLPAGRQTVDRAAARLASVADTTDGSTGKHLALARIGIGLTLQNPWLGVGQDVFHERAQPYADAHLPSKSAALLRPRLSESPHNALLSISVGAGLPALAGFLCFVGLVGQRLMADRRMQSGVRDVAQARTMAMILVGYLVSSFFMTPEVSATVVFWTVAGAACARTPSQDSAGEAPHVR